MSTEALKLVPDAQPGGRLSDLAYARILENLFDRRLPAGAFVSQNDLVKLLGIPVAPLRDALRTLEGEGILTIHPRSGIQFVKPGLELTKSTYQFRTIIERSAVRTFAELGDEDLIEEMGSRHRNVGRDLASKGLTDPAMAELEALELLLHNSVVGILRNPLIDISYKRMHNYIRLVRLDRKLTVPLAQRSIKEHLAIIDACTARDPDGAEAAVVAHFNAALQRHLGMFV